MASGPPRLLYGNGRLVAFLRLRPEARGYALYAAWGSELPHSRATYLPGIEGGLQTELPLERLRAVTPLGRRALEEHRARLAAGDVPKWAEAWPPATR